MAPAPTRMPPYGSAIPHRRRYYANARLSHRGVSTVSPAEKRHIRHAAGAPHADLERLQGPSPRRWRRSGGNRGGEAPGRPWKTPFSRLSHRGVPTVPPGFARLSYRHADRPAGWVDGKTAFGTYAEYRRQVDGLRTGLRQLGYEEGKNIVIHYRWAEGRYDRLPELVAELVNLNVDVLVTHSTPGAQAAEQATSTVSIVAYSGDPVAAGLVASLARPGGNLTGMTFFAKLCAKRVELIKEAMPTLTRLAVLLNPANPQP
jgi:ABC transporter substrate binding protein